jgi:hypothetical protein
MRALTTVRLAARRAKDVTESAADDTIAQGKATPQELLRDLRAGRMEAAYELLGRQAPVKAWREALTTLRQSADSADLELAAHRALRRPPEVVASLLDLIQSAATPQAAFVARAIAALRKEPPLVERGQEIAAAILERHDLELALAADDTIGTLYLVIARDLPQQVEAAERMRREPAVSQPVLSALDTEYDRLLRLGRTVRWTSGSYRYFLRHSLADFALIAEVGGRTGELAFRLLQQQVENPEENERLLEYLPSTVRRVFLAWALERENASQHPRRTRFALRMALKYPDDVERAAVLAVARVDDNQTAVDALTTAVTLDPESSDADRPIIEKLEHLDDDQARRLVVEVFRLEPGRIRLDLIPVEHRGILGQLAASDPPAFARQVAAAVAKVHEPVQIEPLLQVAEQVLGTDAPAEPFAEVAAAVMSKAAADPAWDVLLERSVDGPLFRRAAWFVLETIPPQLLPRALELLTAASEPEEAGVGARRLLEAADDLDPEVIRAITISVAAGRISLPAISRGDAPDLQPLAVAAVQLGTALTSELDDARQVLSQGQVAAEDDLREGLRPIIERAIERAAGNERLQEDYRRLLPRPKGAETAPVEAAVELSAEAKAELRRVGAELSEDGDAIEVDLPSADAEQVRAQLRYLAVLDHRAIGGGASAAEGIALLRPYVEALGRRGDAAALITDLFERGPLLNLAIGLSAETRGWLLDAALANGLVPVPQWYEDAALGVWLGSRDAAGGSAAVSGETSDPLETLSHLRDLGAQVEKLRADVGRIKHDAKLAFVSETSDAFADLETAIGGYVQLWNALAGLGISQVEALGASLERQALDPQRHEIVGAESGERFVVRTAGLVVDGEVVTKAKVEAVSS